MGQIDPERTVASVDVAAGGKTPSIWARWRYRAVAPRVSPTLQMHYVPPWFSALAARLRRNEAETEQFLYERTRSPSTIGDCDMTAGRRTLAALVALLATALLSLAGSAQQAAQNPRIALVIGNATYRDAALATTANDAGSRRTDFASGGV